MGVIVAPPETEEQCERFMKFYNSIDKLLLYETFVEDIVNEQCAAYFYGDRSLDETIHQIQSRVTLYLNEGR